MIWWCIAAALAAGLLAGALAGRLIASRMLRAATAELANASTDPKLRSVVSQISSLAERLDPLQESVEGLLNREKMRRVRQGARLSNEPDPHTDPAGWKAYMRRNRALGG